MQKLTSKFAAGLRPAAGVSHTAYVTYFQQVPTVFSNKYSNIDVRTCNFFLCENSLQNLPKGGSDKKSG
jgi:hypothetical protein